jgi:hypothetical protein
MFLKAVNAVQSTKGEAGGNWTVQTTVMYGVTELS